jgi:hypothetical protein
MLYTVRQMLRQLVVVASICFSVLTPSLAQQTATIQAAATQPQRAPKRPRPAGRITGTVYCNDNHKPARGAMVTITDVVVGAGDEFFQRNTYADSEGHYSFTDVAPGTYTLRAVLPGYIQGPVPDDGPASKAVTNAKNTTAWQGNAIIQSGETISKELILERGAALEGRVVYSDGAPAIRAEVHAELVAAKTAQPQSLPGSITRTDDEGKFRLAGLYPDTYLVSVIPRMKYQPFSLADNTSDDQPRLESLQVFSGDTLHRAAAKSFPLRAGDTLSGVEITVPLVSLFKLHGSISAVDGRIINMGVVTLIDDSDATLRFRSGVQEDGSFDFDAIPSGNYKLTIDHAFITRPNPNYKPDGDTDEEILQTNAFAAINTNLIVKESDLTALHFDLPEIKMPPRLYHKDDSN